MKHKTILKPLMFLMLISMFMAFAVDQSWAIGGAGGNNPQVVTETAERMSYNVLRVILLSIPIVYFVGIVIASVVFAFKSYNRAKNDQVESPGKVAAMTAMTIALVGFGGGGILFLAADRWIFNGQYFSSLANLMSRLMQ